MDIELGEYKAVKDVAMRTGNSAWMLMDGGKMRVEQIDNAGKQALVRCESSIDWMHFGAIKKCFVKI